MNTRELPVSGAVSKYVREVRAALADLPADTVEDLTIGLEADLSDSASESADGIHALPPARAYAAELRAAAGLPEPADDRPHERWWTRDVWTPTVDAWGRARREHPWLARTLTIAEELRPVGWLLRGVVLAAITASLTNVSYSEWALLVTFVGGSIWAGRRRADAGRSGRVVLVVASLLALLAALPVFWRASSALTPHRDSVAVEDFLGEGMWYGGTPVGNVYLYDAEGNRLTDVRAFTDDGRPLDLSRQRLGPDGSPIAPVTDEFATGWSNVLPIPETPGTDPWVTVDGTDGRWRAPTMLAPFGALTPSPSPSVTSSAPTTSPRPSPSPSPTGTATGK